MGMRTTSKKLLLWLYPTQPGWTGKWKDLAFLWPDLTAGGRRSLIAHLQREQLIAVENVLGESVLRLTDHGQRVVHSEFPALSTSLEHWDGVWALLIFLTAPTADPRFRNLRKVVLEQGAGQLTRGVYMYPREFPVPIQQMCQQLYRGRVVIHSVHGWQFGDERSMVEEMFLLSDAAETLSGISRELDQLLNNSIPNFGWSHSQKQHMFTVYDRLHALAATDLGLVNHYFPQVPKIGQLLAQLQQLTTPTL